MADVSKMSAMGLYQGVGTMLTSFHERSMNAAGDWSILTRGFPLQVTAVLLEVSSTKWPPSFVCANSTLLGSWSDYQ
ncbi:unnamed protein product [Arctogadus glacialis]